MGRRVLIIAALLASFLSYEVYANVYASNIRIAPASGAIAKVTFALNDSASVVRVMFKPAAGGAAVRTIVLSDIPFPGDTSVVWDGKTDGGAAAPGGRYYVDIEARQLGGVSTWTQAWENEVYGDHITTGLSCRDVEVNSFPADRNFGFIYMTESTNSYMYNRMLKATAFGNLAAVYDTAAVPFVTNTDPWYMTQTRDGKIYTTLATKAQIRIYNDVQLVDSFTVQAPAGLPAFSPKGIAVDSNKTIYVTSDNYIYRLTRSGGTTTIVRVDSFPSINFFRDIIIDDGGLFYVTGGVGTTYKNVYKLTQGPASAAFNVVDSVVGAVNNVAYLTIYHGANWNSNADDIMYARVVANGVYQISWTAHTFTQIILPPSASTSVYHSIATDIVGNVYYANPSGEWVRMYAPPTGPNSYTTRAIDQVTIPGGGPTPVPISEARKDLNGDFVPDHKVLGDTLLVYGVITTPNFNGTSSTSYYMQDATAGVNIYKSGSPGLVFDLGDSIMVIGKIDQYNGLTELVPLAKDTTKIKVVKKGAKLPTPVKLSVAQYIANGEQYESMLIELDSLRKASTSPAWPGSGLDANLIYTSFNKADTVTIRFDKDTDVPGHAEPSTVVSFTGVATQFISATPPAGGYQLTTRFWATDVKGVTVGVQELPKPVPEAYYLKGNYPNPFNPTTTVEFGVPRDGMVQIAVYNVLGQQVEQLANEYLRAGAHRVVFDARSLVTGTYFCVMKADGRMFTQKMLLVK